VVVDRPLLVDDEATGSDVTAIAHPVTTRTLVVPLVGPVVL
jgi:hypothetical protein